MAWTPDQPLVSIRDVHLAFGKVQVLNFRIVRRQPAGGFCELEPSSTFMIEAGKPQEVDPEERQAEDDASDRGPGSRKT